jgi:hypothetical protein
VNIWLSAMVKLFKPQIIDLLQQRDQKITEWKRLHPGKNVYEDRQLEITSSLEIVLE